MAVNAYFRGEINGTATLYHEFFHAEEYYSGCDAYMVHQYGEVQARYYSEYSAWNFEYSMFNSPKALEAIQYYHKLITK